MTYQEKQARRNARDAHRAMLHEVEDIILRMVVNRVEGNDFVVSSVTIKDIARHLSNKFKISFTHANGFTSLYVQGRPDLFVTKGRSGGIHKLPDPGT